MLNKITIAVALAAFTSLASASDLEAKKAESRAAIMAFGKALKGELTSAMKAGGPINAIGACSEKAPGIAEEISSKTDLTLSRTSLKNRNPLNAANEWQAVVLAGFENAKTDGQDPKTLEYAEIVDTPDGQEYRYMKAIPTGEVCLKCHGSAIKDEVNAKLKELYPDDFATGYKEGDIRGAFVIVDKLSQ